MMQPSKTFLLLLTFIIGISPLFGEERFNYYWHFTKYIKNHQKIIYSSNCKNKDGEIEYAESEAKLDPENIVSVYQKLLLSSIGDHLFTQEILISMLATGLSSKSWLICKPIHEKLKSINSKYLIACLLLETKELDKCEELLIDVLKDSRPFKKARHYYRPNKFFRLLKISEIAYVEKFVAILNLDFYLSFGSSDSIIDNRKIYHRSSLNKDELNLYSWVRLKGLYELRDEIGKRELVKKLESLGFEEAGFILNIERAPVQEDFGLFSTYVTIFKNLNNNCLKTHSYRILKALALPSGPRLSEEDFLQNMGHIKDKLPSAVLTHILEYTSINKKVSSKIFTLFNNCLEKLKLSKTIKITFLPSLLGTNSSDGKLYDFEPIRSKIIEDVNKKDYFLSKRKIKKLENWEIYSLTRLYINLGMKKEFLKILTLTKNKPMTVFRGFPRYYSRPRCGYTGRPRPKKRFEGYLKCVLGSNNSIDKRFSEEEISFLLTLMPHIDDIDVKVQIGMIARDDQIITDSLELLRNTKKYRELILLAFWERWLSNYKRANQYLDKASAAAKTKKEKVNILLLKKIYFH